MLGLRDFIDKNGMPSVVLGLSGGIDSALVAALAVDALGADRVYGVGLPSKWSSEHSLSDAEDSAHAAGHALLRRPDRADGRGVRGVGRAVRRRRGEPAGAGARHAAHGAVQPARAPAAGDEQQERGRRRLLDALRRRRRRVRADQGRAEDAGLGAGPLAQRRGPRAAARPSRSRRTRSTSRRRPSSRPASRTATRCPPTRSSTRSSPTTSTATSAWRSCSSAGTTPRWWRRSSGLVDMAEFKRRQSAPGTKISLKAFGRDRRLPITNRWRETLPTVREGAGTA